MSTRDEILQALRFKEAVVEVAGVSVRLREFSGAARDQFDAGVTKEVDGKRVVDMTNMRAKLVALCAVDDAGQPMFSVEELAAAPASFLEPLATAAQKLNGLISTEDAAKNSEAAPSGNS